MSAASTATAAPLVDRVVCTGRSASVLQTVIEPGVELAAWQREPDLAWAAWLESLPVDAWPACRVEVASEDAAAALDATFEACGTPKSAARDAFAADVVRLVTLFATLAEASHVRLRLDVVTSDACRRWHRDCVPLRLICTYRGPGTQWVAPADAPEVLAQRDDDTPKALAFHAADVALFKGCGWPGQAHEGGIVHRSPRIASTGMARLVLALDAARPATDGQRPADAQPQSYGVLFGPGAETAAYGRGRVLGGGVSVHF